jgi:hypothetical protein
MNLFTNIFTDYKSQLIASQDENKRISNDLDDYKLRLRICQDENNRISNDLIEYKLHLQVGKVKNKQLLNDLDVYKHERDELKSHNIEYEGREELVKQLKLLHDENKKLKEDVIEMRRVIINRKKM